MLLMLEDDAERVQRFRETLRAVDPAMPLLVWRDTRAMIREVGQHLPAARLISLDHDLEPLDGAPDPGDGLGHQLATPTPVLDWGTRILLNRWRVEIPCRRYTMASDRSRA